MARLLEQGDERVRFLECGVPGAFTGYFEEVAAALPDADSEAEAMARVEAIVDGYGVEMDFERTGELVERRELSL